MTAGSAPPVKFDDFLPVTEVQVGEGLVGGVVTGIRKSKSGQSIWFTMLGARGEREWPRESAHASTMVFSRGNPLTSWDDALKPGTKAREMPDQEQVNMTTPAPTPTAYRDAYDAALTAWRRTCDHPELDRGGDEPPLKPGCAGCDAYRAASEAFYITEGHAPGPARGGLPRPARAETGSPGPGPEMLTAPAKAQTTKGRPRWQG
jgi:hypothetical protein